MPQPRTVLTADGRRAMLAATRGHTAAIRRYFVGALDDDAATLESFSRRVLEAIGDDASPDHAASGDDPGVVARAS